MPVLNAPLAEARVWVWPVDPQAAFRAPCALNQSFAALLSPDEGEGDSAVGTSVGAQFDSVQWQGQRALRNVSGPLSFVRLLADGSVRRGVREAPSARPGDEICGFTVAARTTRLQGTINETPGLPGATDADLRPRLPDGEPVIEWISEQGDSWERLMPARLPLHAGIRHRAAPANRTVKARTKANRPKDEPVAVGLDFAGVAWGHRGDPALRIEWGGIYSLLLRGIGKNARAMVERKGADASGAVKWRKWRRLDNGPALDESFWRSRHEVFIYQLAGLLIVEFDGLGCWIGATKGGKIAAVEWKAAPLRVSIVGADCIVTTTQSEFDSPVAFESETETGEVPQFPVPFEVKSNRVATFPVGSRAGSAKMHGVALERTSIEALWHNQGGLGAVSYLVKMQGTAQRAPLLCSWAAQFPATSTLDPPPAINLRPALASLDIESGEPESLPSAEARMDVLLSHLQKFVPGWEAAVLPFRPVHIEVDPANDDNWDSVFFGYLLPDGFSSDGFLSERISLVGRDPLVRLREPAALIDGRFAPLDLLVEESGADLYGSQCFKHLLEMELGEEVAENLNGNGDPFRYTQPGHYPLINTSGNDYFRATAVPLSGGFLLPPPHGDDLERWFGKISDFDGKVWFFDPKEGARGAWMYGDIEMFFAARGQNPITLNDSTENSTSQDLSSWPLLGQYNAQGLLSACFTEIQIWGAAPEATTAAFVPTLFTGFAGAAPDPFSLDPLSENQSWRRTFLVRQEFIGKTEAGADFADALAWRIWSEFDGRAPQRWDFTLKDQIFPTRWGERLDFAIYELRIVRTALHFTFIDTLERSTTITARSLSARGL